ncbi:hypothetical protein CAEBREN_09423 [Caenorhabditis brenneri]|uniref:NR LBD domain-containing protein n=1 Tax=Caenorhabditis brenneri TaxID=135651 RepID=G0MLS1_CAEBE|nr:hypothetical protein CAEBREN_09423 [Caenorhabditis brenneri]
MSVETNESIQSEVSNGHSENGHSNGNLEAKMKLLKLGTDKEDKPGKTAHLKRSREEEEFQLLVHSYGEHQRWMQLSFMSVEQFLEETEEGKGQKLREMKPTDVNELSIVELSGLMYWIDKQNPYTKLPMEDKAALLKRYSVRKLSLDHFYRASKHPQYVARREFVMNNGTFVPANRTGFELPEDDIQQIEAKRMTFARTFDRFWNNVIIPFMNLNVNDAEITFIHIMMLWSTRNDEYVTGRTRAIMTDRRSWALDQLYRWYLSSNDWSSGTAEDRLDTICSLLKEIESICDQHCQDFQVAKMFEFCDMSKFWYETLCYAPCNIDFQDLDSEMLEKLKQFSLESKKKKKEATNDDGVKDQNTVEEDPTLLHEEIDPNVLGYNVEMVENVMAPLPDDNPEFANDLEIKRRAD